MATASWYVGLRTGGGGGAGGATGATGFTVRTAGLAAGFAAGLAARAVLVVLAADRVEAARDAAGRAGLRRSVWALFLVLRAGLRAEVRDLVTRRDLAMVLRSNH